MKTVLILLILLTLFSMNTFAQDVQNTVLEEHSGDVWGVAFSPDGAILASRSADDTIRLWDVATSTVTHTLRGHSGDVWSIAFHPDGNTIASGSRDNTIRLWDVATGALKYTLTAHTEGVWKVAFSSDGLTLASGSYDDTIRLWDVDTGSRKAKFTEIESTIHNFAFSPDGVTLVSLSGVKIHLWDVATGTIKHTLIGHTYNVWSIAFSPDGNTIASGSRDNTIRLWNVATGTIKNILTGHSDEVWDVVFSPDGATLASSSRDNTIRLWDVAAGTIKHTLTGHREYVSSVAFSPNGLTLASGSYDNTIRLWDVETGEHLGTLTEHSADVNSVAFSPDGNLFASGSDDNTIRLWKYPAKVSITPNPVVSPVIGGEFSININITEGVTLGGYQLTLEFDHTAIRYVSSINGDYLTEGSYFVQPIVENNNVTLGATNFANANSGNGVLATITFEVVDVKESNLNLSNVILTDSDGNRLSYLVGGSKIVEPPPVPTSAVVSVTLSSVLSPARRQLLILNVDIAGGQNVAGFRLSLSYDSTALERISSRQGIYVDGGVGNGDGTLFSETYRILEVKASNVNVSGHLIGTDGLRYIPTFESASVVVPLFGDVNRDGVVNIIDLVLVASSFNQDVPKDGNPADVNEDDVVNIVDLVKVAGVIGGGAAAPAVLSQDIDVAPSRKDVQKWLSEAQQLNLTDPTSQRGILFLEQLLAALTPKKTSLLPNYPNPFNPETWIPYQLAKPADVTMTIYAVDGTVVRTLALGHQLVGIYQGKNRAAHWDGKNAVGESVASGVYFYTLKAGDFTATRKMLIRK